MNPTGTGSAEDAMRPARRGAVMATRASVKNEKQYEALKDKGMSKERAAKIANSPDASSKGGKKSGSGGNSKQGGTTAQKKEAGRKGGKATAKKS
jgi:general stress protein YciG